MEYIVRGISKNVLIIYHRQGIFEGNDRICRMEFLGNCAWLLNTQGVNILMNLYFGVAVNAARGIATQVDSALRQFVNNFTTAVNPQITKSYAQGDLSYMHKLMVKSSKFSAF